ncbi:MAG: aldo/keto reductase [Aquisalimonadaceae bacterium]
MKIRSKGITRRQALRLGAGMGAGFLFSHTPLLADTASSGPASGTARIITKAIPSSGETLPVIGVGTARRFNVGESDADRARIRQVLQLLPRLGGRVVDTAPSYGTAETVIGDLVADLGNRDQLFIATKVRQQTRSAAMAEIEQSFQRLRTDRIDLLYIHNLVGWRQVLPLLRELKAEGRIRYLGISTHTDAQYDALAEIMEREELDAIQVDYAIDNRSAEDRMLPLARDRGIGVFTNLPFGRGRVFQAFRDQPIPEWAAAYGISSWAQFALMFVASHPAVTVAIPGTATPDYLRDNIGTAHGSLPDASTRQRMAALVDRA